MKILYVIHQFFPRHYTGTERLTLDIAKQIQRLGHHVSVLTYEPSPPIENSSKFLYKVKSEEEDFKKIDDYMLRKDYQVESIPVIALKHDKFKYGFEVFEDELEKHLFEIIKGFDVVHFTHPMRFSSALKVCKKLKISTVLTLTDNWLLCPRGLFTLEKQLCNGPQEGRECMKVCKYDDRILSRYNEAKWFFQNVDRIFSGTNFVRQTFWENGWQRNIELNTFSIDYSYVSAEEPPNGKQIVFAFIGSLIWQKGIHILINAFRKVENKNIKLKIYGRGAETDTYVKHLMNLRDGLETTDIPKIDERIEFCGTFEYKDLSHIMKEISVIVIPSAYKEIFPLVMQMALAYKKPIIATDIGGMPDVIHDGINGHLFPINDDNELAKIIQMFTDNPKRIEELRQNIKPPRRIEEECLVYENAYRELLSV